MKRRRIKPPPLGNQFGRSDLERLGYFHDPTPGPFDSYEGTYFKFRQGIEKGRQMLPGPPIDLFERKFGRIFNGEALNEPWRFEAKERLVREKAKLGRRMLPPSPAKKHSTPGDWHGCFEKVSYFSPATKAVPKRKLELPNAKIKPNPLGGPGYADICLNPYPPYSHEPYDHIRKNLVKDKKVRGAGRFLCASAPLDYFPPNPYLEVSAGPTYERPTEVAQKMIGPGRIYVPFPKKPGGNHSGCFNKYPEYPVEPYYIEIQEKKVEEKFLVGGPPLRTKFTNSIINQVTNVSCNASNYLKYREQVYKLDK